MIWGVWKLLRLPFCSLIDSIHFAASSVLVCDFHRLQAWHRWLVKSSNGVSKTSATVLKHHLKVIASSPTEEELNVNIAKLKSCDEWQKHPNFQSYINQTWLCPDMCKVSNASSLQWYLHVYTGAFYLSHNSFMERCFTYCRDGCDATELTEFWDRWERITALNL